MIVSITVLLAVKLRSKSKNTSTIKFSLPKQIKILHKINKKVLFYAEQTQAVNDGRPLWAVLVHKTFFCNNSGG